MARGDEAHGGRSSSSSRTGTVVLLLALVLVVGAAVAWRDGLLDRWLDDDIALPSDPAAIAPPEGLDLPQVTAPPAVAPALAGQQRVDTGAVRLALADYLSDRDLGRHVLAEVAALDGGAPVFDRGEGGAIPASITKLVTTSAALLALGPDHVFDTTVVSGRRGQVVLVGGGDPFLSRSPESPKADPPRYPVRADVETLAASTARRLKRDGVRRVSVGYDAGLFGGPAVNPAWEDDYISSGVVSPTSALWVDEGRSASGYGRVGDPAAEAARTFADALAEAGITVRGDVAEASGRGDEIASVSSAPLSAIVGRILDVSDNEAAEVLLRQVGLAEGGDGSIESGRRGVIALLRQAGVRLGASVLNDGSGLSRANVLDPQVLVDVLRLAASPTHPDLRPVVAGLPVAGFTGSLANRMDKGPPEGLGRVRAKTGTLAHVSSLAGLATDLDGTALVFVLMADRVKVADELKARVALDSAAAALGACHCSARG